MSVEWYAPVVVLVGLALWLSGTVAHSVAAMLFFTLFGGGAALIIGHASIQPAYVFLPFLVVHLLLTTFRRSGHVNIGLKTNGFLAWYCLYSAATAVLLPRIFARTMDVAPMQENTKEMYLVNVLRFTFQNITTAVYLLGTLIASICAGAASADPKSRKIIVHWAIIIAWVHIAFGLLGLVSGASEIIGLFRNATYAELTQSTNVGFDRIAGIFPETSAYAAFGFVWLVFTAELWLRGVAPIRTGFTAAAMTVMLIACTSTTAYAALVVYMIVMVGRWIVSPSSLRWGKVLPVVMAGLMVVTLSLAVFAFFPSFATAAGRLLNNLTVGKADTASGRQRYYWAETGIKAFMVSRGLGIGAGSFRSSSFIIAVIGSTGILGMVTFAGHFFKVLKPFRADTYAIPGEAKDAVGMSAAWAACAGLIPAMLSFPSPDPGLLFAVMGGLALGWRYSPDTKRAGWSRVKWPSEFPRDRGYPEGTRIG